MTSEPLYIDKVIENKNSIAQLISADIFSIRYKEGSVCEVFDFEEVMSAYDELRNGQKLKVLTIFEKYVNATPEGREFIEAHDAPITAEAMVFTGLSQRILVRFYMAVRKQKHPIKTFSSIEKATAWLNNFKV